MGVGRSRASRGRITAAAVAVTLVSVLVTAGASPAGAATSADLSVTLTRVPNVAQALVDVVRFTAVVTNSGPDAAQNVVLVDPLGTVGGLVEDVESTRGTCESSAYRQVTCALGTMASGATATVTIDMRIGRSGLVTNTVAVTTSTADPDPDNDIASVSVVMTEPPSFEEIVVTAYFRGVLGIEPNDDQLDRWEEKLYEYGYEDLFALELLKTYTFRSKWVDETYRALLDRPADASGLRTFTRALSQGATYEQVTATLAGSSEYVRKAGGTATGFIDQLLRDLTGHPPTTALRDDLLNQLADGGSTTEVAQRIARSQLARGAWIRRMHRQYLGREAFNFEEVRLLNEMKNGQRPARVLSKIVGTFELVERYFPDFYYWESNAA